MMLLNRPQNQCLRPWTQQQLYINQFKSLVFVGVGVWCNRGSECNVPALDCQFAEKLLKRPINGATFTYFGQTGVFAQACPWDA